MGAAATRNVQYKKRGGPAATRTGQYKMRGAAAMRDGQYKKPGRCRNEKRAVYKAGVLPQGELVSIKSVEAAVMRNGQFKIGALPQREMGSIKSGALPQRKTGRIKRRGAAATRKGQ